MEFKDKIVLITGAGSGIGQITAYTFAKEGAKVVVSDINEENGKVTTERIQADGGESVFIKADVAIFEEVEALMHSAIAHYGKVDIAINNAGVGGFFSKTADTSLESWEQVMAVNASGVFYGMKTQIPHMLAQGGGVIINTSSVAGLRGLPKSVAYTASKHAVVGMTKTAAMEYARNNIRINAVCPVFTVTAMFQPDVMDSMSPGISKKLMKNLPMKRFGKPIEIANAILWLCSEKASFITGHALPIDGGLTA